MAVPVHEKFAVILSDRRNLIEKLAQYTKSNENPTSVFPGNTNDSNENEQIQSLLDKIDTLETEINILKETNIELSDHIQNLKLEGNDNGFNSGTFKL